MPQKKNLLFVYDFPHAKSVDFIHQCVKENIQIDVIVAASHKNIKKTKRVLNYNKYGKISSKIIYKDGLLIEVIIYQ